MNKLALVAFTVTVAAAAFAENAATKTTQAKRPDSTLRFLGGKIVRPRSQQGKIAFINTQDKVSAKNIYDVAAYFAHETGFKIDVLTAVLQKPAALKKSSGANAAVIVVANDDDPPMLVAPEEGWAVVNFSKLKAGLADNALAPKMYETRCRKQLLRAFNILCGGFGSSYKGNVINVARVEDLDVGEEGVPYDTIQLYKPYMKSIGVTPAESVFYRTAVKEGWAPAPTNDIQRGVWEKVKAEKEKGPSNPIKIAPPKK